MPHLTVEYSANLEARVDIDAFLEAMSETLRASALFSTGGIRVRAHKAAHWTIADGHPQNAFMTLLLRIGPGRSPAEKRATGDALMCAAKTALSDELAKPFFALSLEVAELDPDFRWNANAIHRRLDREGASAA